MCIHTIIYGDRKQTRGHKQEEAIELTLVKISHFIVFYSKRLMLMISVAKYLINCYPELSAKNALQTCLECSASRIIALPGLVFICLAAVYMYGVGPGEK